MTRLPALLALALLALALLPGCDVILGEKCLDGPTGCALPGTWTLVAVDGAPQTGSLQINDGQFDRGGYGRLPLSATERIAGPFTGTYSTDDEDVYPYHMAFSITQDDGQIWRADVYAQAEVSGASMTLRFGTVRVPEGILTVNSRYPLFKAGSVLTFKKG